MTDPYGAPADEAELFGHVAWDDDAGDEPVGRQQSERESESESESESEEEEGERPAPRRPPPRIVGRTRVPRARPARLKQRRKLGETSSDEDYAPESEKGAEEAGESESEGEGSGGEEVELMEEEEEELAEMEEENAHVREKVQRMLEEEDDDSADKPGSEEDEEVSARGTGRPTPRRSGAPPVAGSGRGGAPADPDAPRRPPPCRRLRC